MNTHITDIPEIRRLQRSRSDRKLAGVSGDLARYFEIHPACFRVGFVVLTLREMRGQIFFVPPAAGADDLRTPSPHAWTRRWTVVTEQPRLVAISRRL